MDFEVTYTEEQQQFRREVRAWLETNVPADVQRTPTSPEDNYQRYLELRAFGRKLGAKGWLYPTAPAKYGGGGLDVDYAIILEEEVDRLDLSLPPYYDSGGRLGSASILVWGTEKQRQAFLPAIYHGEVRTWQLLTEPGAGSDLAGVRMTTAARDGDEYVIKGQKIFVGSDNGADRIWLIACTTGSGAAWRSTSSGARSSASSSVPQWLTRRKYTWSAVLVPVPTPSASAMSSSSGTTRWKGGAPSRTNPGG